MSLERRVAMVTGAARGIGLAIAKALAREGAAVALCDVSTSLLDAAVEEITTAGGEALAFQADVTDRQRIAAVVSRLMDRFARIDILVNNAGIYEVLSLDEISEQQWDRMLAVNLKGVFLCTQAVLPVMRRQGEGWIVNMTSSAGKTGGLLCGAHYAASKAGVISLTKSVAREAASHGIRVNAIAPGRIDTPMIHTVSEEENEALRRQIPLGRIGTPEDVARAVVFLVSDEASYITGEILDVNGGSLMD
jgi:3-oxoacyl-[acyl-carrier protein] reductase